MTNNLADLLQRYTVAIAPSNCTEQGVGFLIAPGLILTATPIAELLDVGTSVQTYWQKERYAEAQVVQVDSQHSLALLQFIPPSRLSPPYLRLGDAVEIDDPLLLFYFPGSDSQSKQVATGLCKGFSNDEPPFITVDCDQVPQNVIGAALLNQVTGAVCGFIVDVDSCGERTSSRRCRALTTAAVLESFPQLRELRKKFHQSDMQWQQLVELAKTHDFSNRSISIQGDASARVVSGDRNSFETSTITQQGKYNINSENMSSVHIGDVINQAQSEPARDTYVQSNTACQNRDALERYRERTLQVLRQNGCLDIREGIEQGSYQFNYTARIEDFELSFWPVNLRGEAFFIFSEFSTLQMKQLRQFSGRARRWAKTQKSAGAGFRALYNARLPSHFCFAVALVDDLDEDIRQSIHTTNPLDHTLDLMWYEVLLVYELNKEQLHFYDQPSSFLENFKGEVVWKPLRRVMRSLFGTPLGLHREGS